MVKMKIFEKIKNFLYEFFSSKKIKRLKASEQNLQNELPKETKEEYLKNEKTRIMNLYKGVKDNVINLKEIDIEDLKKIRKLFYEEAKIHDRNLESEINSLEKMIINGN